MLLPSDILVYNNLASLNEAWTQLEHLLNQEMDVYPGRALYAPYALQADAMRLLDERGFGIGAGDALLVLNVWHKRAYSTMLKFRDFLVIPRSLRLGFPVQPLTAWSFAVLGAHHTDAVPNDQYGVLLHWSADDLQSVRPHAHLEAMEALARAGYDHNGFFRGLATRIALQRPGAGLLIAETWQSKAAWEVAWRTMQPILDAHGLGSPAIVEAAVPSVAAPAQSASSYRAGNVGFTYISPRRR